MSALGIPSPERIAAFVVIMLIVTLWLGWVDSIRKEGRRANRR